MPVGTYYPVFHAYLQVPGSYDNDGHVLKYVLYENESGETDFILNPKLKLEVNKAGSFEFDILPSHSLYNSIRRYVHYVRIEEINHVIKNQTVEEKTEIIFYGRILSISMDFSGTKHVTCEGLLANLLDCPMFNYNSRDVKDLYTIKEVPNWALTHAIQCYRNLIRTDIERVGYHPGTPGYNEGMEIEYISVNDYDEIVDVDVSGGQTAGDFITSEIIDVYGGFLKIAYREVGEDKHIVGGITWEADPTMDNYDWTASNQTIEFGDNMLNMSAEFNDDEISTGIAVTWQNDEEEETSGEGENENEQDNETQWIATTMLDVDSGQPLNVPVIYGGSGNNAIGIKIVNFNVKTQSDAISLGQRYVDRYCNFDFSSGDFDSFTIKMIDWHYFKNPETYDPIMLYDNVHIVSQAHNVDVTLPCTAIEIDIDNPSNNSYTFTVFRPKASSNDKVLTHNLNARK